MIQVSGKIAIETIPLLISSTYYKLIGKWVIFRVLSTRN